MKDKLYKHYKNKRYYIITGKCMLQVDNEWVDAIIYRREGGEQLFCREKSEFLNKFKLEE